MTLGSKKYRQMMAYLDGKGLMVSIERVSRKQFSLLVNGSILKTYKKRDSCNQKIVKISII